MGYAIAEVIQQWQLLVLFKKNNHNNNKFVKIINYKLHLFYLYIYIIKIVWINKRNKEKKKKDIWNPIVIWWNFQGKF
jgi:hypothetical protein